MTRIRSSSSRLAHSSSSSRFLRSATQAAHDSVTSAPIAARDRNLYTFACTATSARL